MRGRTSKKAKGFNTTDVPLEFCLLQGEVAEAFDVWRKGRLDVGEELGEVATYLFGLAEMTGVDLQREVEAKLTKNAGRSYRPLSNGVLVKSDDERTASEPFSSSVCFVDLQHVDGLGEMAGERLAFPQVNQDEQGLLPRVQLPPARADRCPVADDPRHPTWLN